MEWHLNIYIYVCKNKCIRGMDGIDGIGGRGGISGICGTSGTSCTSGMGWGMAWHSMD